MAIVKEVDQHSNGEAPILVEVESGNHRRTYLGQGPDRFIVVSSVGLPGLIEALIEVHQANQNRRSAGPSETFEQLQFDFDVPV